MSRGHHHLLQTMSAKFQILYIQIKYIKVFCARAFLAVVLELLYFEKSLMLLSEQFCYIAEWLDSHK